MLTSKLYIDSVCTWSLRYLSFYADTISNYLKVHVLENKMQTWNVLNLVLPSHVTLTKSRRTLLTYNFSYILRHCCINKCTQKYVRGRYSRMNSQVHTSLSIIMHTSLFPKRLFYLCQQYWHKFSPRSS